LRSCPPVPQPAPVGPVGCKAATWSFAGTV
jgi:hypothetical protein